MRILLIDNHSLHTKALEDLLADHEVVISDYLNADYSNSNYDLIILSGSHEQPFYSESYAKELELIKSTEMPVVWICLGCQLIAHAYGAEIHNNESKLQGVYEIKDLRNHKKYMVYEGHSFCIDQLSDELEWLAASEYGYEIIKHKSKPQRWVQFHPEVEDGVHNGELLLTIILADSIS